MDDSPLISLLFPIPFSKWVTSDKPDWSTLAKRPRADGHLDAIVHKSVEHQPTLIQQGINPPYVSTKGVPMLNTFLVYVPSITVPSGFTTDNLPVGITFLGKPYSDATMIKLAYSYEQSTHHRQPPKTTPALR